MTRETKIGLLVGLAFIIVIGILLSDQLMRSTEPPPAALSSVADTLRKGTVTPASNNPPVTRVMPPQAGDVSPDTAVPTKDEINRPQPPVTIVEIRPGNGVAGNGGNAGVPAGAGGNVVINTGGRNLADYPVAPPGQAGRAIGLAGSSGGGVVDNTAGRSLADVAAAAGETLIGPDGQPLRASPHGLAPMPPIYPGHDQNPVRPQVPQVASVKQYKAEAGDSLSRIASRQMGADTKANRDAIIKANPSLTENPDMIIAGRTYAIPVVGAPALPPGQTPTAGGRQPNVPAQPPVTADRTPAPIKAAGGEYWYQVKPGDSLTKIAKEQLGDASTVAAIRELNRDAVKDWNKLNVGTKLKLPARPVASVH
jgi:nucleoid-associated protein YgaU